MKLRKEGNKYFISSKKVFNHNTISEDLIIKSFEFAYQMTFGKGHHRIYRSGGSKNRSIIEVFYNTLQGKVSEFILHKLFTEKACNCSNVDTSIHGKGLWDAVDLIVNSKKISIKSTAFYSNLLLLETKDWNDNGKYTPNDTFYDYFVLVRIKPNISSSNYTIKNLTKKDILSYLRSIDWFYDIPGCFSQKTLKTIIQNNYILPKRAVLNDSIIMDAENYYIQSGDLKDIELLIKILN